MGFIENVERADWRLVQGPASFPLGAKIESVRVRTKVRFPEFETFVVTCEKTATSLVARLSRVPATAGQASADDLEFGIEKLDAYEQQVATEYRRLLKSIERLHRQLRAADPESLRVFIPLTERFREAMVKLLEAYRDARWALIAHLSHIADADDEPVLTSAKEVSRRLSARKA